jgi:hypothetical protein
VTAFESRLLGSEERADRARRARVVLGAGHITSSDVDIPAFARERWTDILRYEATLRAVEAERDAERQARADIVATGKKIIADLVALVDALRGEVERLRDRMFPIMDGPSIPWWLIAPHEAQAKKNHDQTLERLAQRGGLSCYEAVHVLRDEHWRVGEDRISDDAHWRAQLVAIRDADVMVQRDAFAALLARIATRLEDVHHECCGPVPCAQEPGLRTTPSKWCDNCIIAQVLRWESGEPEPPPIYCERDCEHEPPCPGTRDARQETP